MLQLQQLQQLQPLLVAVLLLLLLQAQTPSNMLKLNEGADCHGDAWVDALWEQSGVVPAGLHQHSWLYAPIVFAFARLCVCVFDPLYWLADTLTHAHMRTHMRIVGIHESFWHHFPSPLDFAALHTHLSALAPCKRFTAHRCVHLRLHCVNHSGGSASMLLLNVQMLSNSNGFALIAAQNIYLCHHPTNNNYKHRTLYIQHLEQLLKTPFPTISLGFVHLPSTPHAKPPPRQHKNYWFTSWVID